MRKMGVGIQLYTLRNEMEQDFRGTLRKLAELGYEGVEFAGYGGIPAEEMKSLLQELGLQAIGSHVSLQALQSDLQQEIDYLTTIGAKYMICPYVNQEDRRDAEDWKRRFAFFQEVGTEARKQGIIFSYHNHEFEFESRIGETSVFDALYEATSPEAVQVEMDVCWVQFAGQDPLVYIPKYAGRLPLLHLKDFTRNEDGSMKTLELGQGDVDLPAVLQASSDAGVEWLIVEQDVCQNPPLESVANSLNWVERHYLNFI
ncbi:sugar phosphate isomerase/epimerase family protein [Paenibacillus beijingensis]|uniref:Sugar phosphate isomerase n=1 Tax=Paenibacillus beijingensis TaxID=1126833 RepID=A0A0D5NGJ2_9BACL|nr:sugar phosphate isomerase/epimerase [Paenibacillus beijingensis]AJY74381.1 sugar phosphate isomerase [Paenibacillus beijingensis]